MFTSLFLILIQLAYAETPKTKTCASLGVKIEGEYEHTEIVKEKLVRSDKIEELPETWSGNSNQYSKIFLDFGKTFKVAFPSTLTVSIDKQPPKKTILLKNNDRIQIGDFSDFVTLPVENDLSLNFSLTEKDSLICTETIQIHALD